MANSIAQSIQRCFDLFRNLLDLPPIWGANTRSLIQDNAIRFRVWTGDIGALQEGQPSLEYRLRDASDIRSEILRLLGELGVLLDDACALGKGERIPWDEMSQDGSVDDEDDDDDEDDESLYYHDDKNTDDGTVGDKMLMPATEIEQTIRNIDDIITCLLRHSVSIMNPAPNDFFEVGGASDTSHYESHDILHVQTKFPELDERVAERLGRSNSRRREYFRYRQLQQAMSEPGESGTVAVNEDDALRYGTFRAASSTSPREIEDLGIPPLPAEAQNGPFQCPFCFDMIVATSMRAWTQHIFRDLRPYICLDPVCDVPDKSYSVVGEWIDHMSRNHWRVWSCPITTCWMSFGSAGSCEMHVSHSHRGSFSPSRLPYAVRFAAKPLDDGEARECLFCGHVSNQIHEARHLEELSLLALPEFNAQSQQKQAEKLGKTFTDIAKIKSTVDDTKIPKSGSERLQANRLQAAENLEKLLDDFNSAYGKDDTSTLNCMDDLASAYVNLSRYQDAVDLHARVIDVQTLHLGPSHPDTQLSMAKLASVYNHMGRRDEAKKLEDQLALHPRTHSIPMSYRTDGSIASNEGVVTSVIVGNPSSHKLITGRIKSGRQNTIDSS